MKTPVTNYLFIALFFAFSASQAQTRDLSHNTKKNTTHNLLMAAVKATDIHDVLVKSGPFTVFAPSDDAFEKFSPEKMQEWMNSSDKSKLKSLLGYHIVAGKLTASKILMAMCRGEGKASFTTIQGKKLQAHMDGYDIVLTDSMGNTARIIQADVNEKNAIVHQIDSVIVPSQL